MSTSSTSAPSRAERILAFMLIGVFLVSIVALVVVLVATWAGHTDFGGSVWPVVAMTPYFGLPLSFLLVFALLIIATVRRARSARRDDGV